METVLERLRGAVIGFVLAQFVSVWIAYPLCVVALVVYATSPLVQAERLRTRAVEVAMRWAPRMFPTRTTAVPTTMDTMFDIPVTSPL
jgi:hypothetical protein